MSVPSSRAKRFQSGGGRARYVRVGSVLFYSHRWGEAGVVKGTGIICELFVNLRA